MKAILKMKGLVSGAMEEEGLGKLVLSLCFSWLLSGFHWILSISGPKFPLSLSLSLPPSEFALSKLIRM